MSLTNYRKVVSAGWVIFFSTTIALSQSKPIEALAKLYNDYPQEKIYVWLNKSGYIAGETAWFKAYDFSGYELSQISSNLYIELLDRNKISISSKRYPLLYGTSHGSIDLDSSLAEGVYYLRAYTDWMLNFDEKFQYIKAVPIYNPLSTTKLEANNFQWDAAVFPEGGSLIDGLESKVAIRFFSQTSMAGNWTGHVVDGSGTEITSVRILDPNVAWFDLKPEAGKKYKVMINDPTGNTKTIDLPDVKKSGAVISASCHGDSLYLHLRFKNIPRDGIGYSLVGEIQDQAVYEAGIVSANTTVDQFINTKDLQNGILHLTLFDPDYKAVSERLVFLNPSRLLYDTTSKIDLSFDSSPRAKNEMAVSVDSANWSSYAVSIADDDIPSEENKESLLSALWLTSDIRSPIVDPASYFSSPDADKLTAFDALLISEKWKRFSWDSVLSSKFPVIKYPPEKFLSFNGTIITKKQIPEDEGINILMGNPGVPFQVINAKVDSTKKIYINNVLINGDFYSLYRMNNKKRYSGTKINIDFKRIDHRVPFQGILPETKYHLKEKADTISQPAWIQQQYRALQYKKEIDARYKTLQEVVVTSNIKSKKEQLHDQLVTGKFRASYENVFDFVNEKQDLIKSPSLYVWLQGKVPGLITNYDTRSFSWMPSYFPGSKGHGRILTYLNEGEIEPDWLSLIPLDEIIFIKVITYPRSMIFDQDVGLVIAVYTETDSLVAAARQTIFNDKKLKGYDVSKEYTQPQYDNDQLQFPGKDVRSELLWQSILIPDDSTFRKRLTFFNNDSVKNLRLIIQGFNKDGLPVYINKLIRSTAAQPF